MLRSPSVTVLFAFGIFDVGLCHSPADCIVSADPSLFADLRAKFPKANLEVLQLVASLPSVPARRPLSPMLDPKPRLGPLAAASCTSWPASLTDPATPDFCRFDGNPLAQDPDFQTAVSEIKAVCPRYLCLLALPELTDPRRPRLHLRVMAL